MQYGVEQMSECERSPNRTGLRVNFSDKGEVKERREKFLTAKYGSHQMSLIKKRLAVEMWLYAELQKLFEPPSEAIDIDIDEILDLDTDDIRRSHLITTIIGIEFVDGVIIAADSRTSTGTYVANRVTDKLTKITDYVYCCRSGSAADTQAIADIVSYNMYLHENATGKPAGVVDVAKEFQQICYTYRSQLTAGIIVAGYDNNTKKGEIYSIPLGGMMFKEMYTIGGSGSSYIYGFMESQYNSGQPQRYVFTQTIADLDDGTGYRPDIAQIM